MCRSRHQTTLSTFHQTQPIYSTPRQRREARRQARFERRLQHGCCSKRARRYQESQLPHNTHTTHTTVHINPNSTNAAISDIARKYTVPSHLQVPTQPSQTPLCTPVKYRGPITTMAALIIGGIGLGAQKLQEKREKRKAKKEQVAWESEQVAEASRVANLQHAERIEGWRKSEEARGDRARSSESLERERGESGVLPPSYEEVVQTGAGAGRGRA